MNNTSLQGMRITAQKKKFLFGAVLSMMLVGLPFSQALAANVITYPQDSTLHMTGNGADLTILAGSAAQSLSVTSTTFTVTVAAGGTFTVRWPGPGAGTLTNDSGLVACQPTGGNNNVPVIGPSGPVVFTPNAAVHCPNGGSGGGA